MKSPLSRYAQLAIGMIAVLAGGCAELHSSESALNPAGPQAQRISHLAWLFIWICVGAYILTMLALLGAFVRRHPKDDVPDLNPDLRREKRIWTVVSGCIVATVVI